MIREIVVLIIIWTVSVYLLLFKVSQEKKRIAHITFIFAQAIAWLFEVLQVAGGFIEFPYREFPHASKLSFSLYYIFYPTFSVFFILHYPKRKVFLYYLFFNGVISIIAALIEQYTDLIEFVKWNWFMGFLTLIVLTIIIRLFVIWFQKGMETEAKNV